MANSDDCKDIGVLVPVIDRGRCEAKADCVDVCPYHVFEIRPLVAADKAALSLLGRLKARAHGNRQAYAVRAADCHACGACVTACPEKAIKLRAPA
jgi:4Fe-4S ferredoxin